jgi:hypothetical protein
LCVCDSAFSSWDVTREIRRPIHFQLSNRSFAGKMLPTYPSILLKKRQTPGGFLLRDRNLSWFSKKKKILKFFENIFFEKKNKKNKTNKSLSTFLLYYQA